jgi:hypothetical protein
VPAILLASAAVGNLAAGTNVGPPWQIRTGPGQAGSVFSLTAQKTFTYGSGGTTVDTYLQTSFDGGNTWADVIHWAQNLLASDARPFVTLLHNLTTPAIPAATTDGTQTVNTINAGIFGLWWRVKYVVVGTYAGATALRVDLSGANLVPAGVGSFN